MLIIARTKVGCFLKIAPSHSIVFSLSYRTLFVDEKAQYFTDTVRFSRTESQS